MNTYEPMNHFMNYVKKSLKFPLWWPFLLLLSFFISTYIINSLHDIIIFIVLSSH